MFNWLVGQWKQVRGHVKYDLIKWAVFAAIATTSTAIPFALHGIQSFRHAPQQDLLGYLILGLLIFCALICSALFVRQRQTKTDDLTIEDVIQIQPGEPPAPKPVDLRGSVLNLYFREVGYAAYEVFMKLRITNHGLQEATVTECVLDILIGEDQSTGTQIQIPATLQLETEESNAVGVIRVNHTALIPTISPDDVYRKAIPWTRWIAFGVTAWGNQSLPYNAAFMVRMTDSLGGEHSIDYPPQPYIKSGEIVVVEPPELPMLRNLLLRPPK